ncbi:MAG: hypothetical protein ACSLE6_11090 [Mycobacterium sp.]
MKNDEIPYSGRESLREAWSKFKQDRAPKDVVPPQRRTDRQLPQGPTEVRSIEIDDDGIPRQVVETAWVSQPFEEG